MKNDDVQLIQRTLDGDEAAFSMLVKKHQRSVHALAWRKISDFHIAEDITQDTFLKAYQKLPTLKEPQRFASWLYVITANQCKAWLRKKRLRTQSLETASGAEMGEATYSGYVSAENARITAEAQREVVKKLLAKLQESERTVITLYYLGGMTYEEISKFLGVSVAAIKNRLYRARKRLKKEEPMIREALEHFQITPNLTENIMREISRLKPMTPSGSQPLVPWAVGVSTLTVILFTLGIGNQQYLSRFQKPYSFDAPSEMTVELIEAPVVLNFEAKPDIRTQLGNVRTPNEGDPGSQQPNDVSASAAEAESDETIQNYAHWHLPRAAKARLGKGGITTIQFSPDGTLLAVGSHIGVWLYDVETGEEKALLGSGMCDALSFSPDGRFLSISSKETLIQLWEIATERAVPLIDLYGNASVLRFSSDGKTLIGLSKLGHAAITRLNIDNGRGKTKHLKTGLFGTGLFSSEDFSGVHAMTIDKIAIGKKDGIIQLWDVATRTKLSTLKGHVDLSTQPLDETSRSSLWFKNWILVLAFSPDGTHLASGSTDKTVRLCNLTSDDEWITLQKHTGWINVLAFSPDGSTLASGGTDKTVQLWNTTTGAPLVTLTGHLNDITALAFSPDGRTLVSGSTDGTIRFWNIETGMPLDNHITGHTQSMKAVTFFRDSSTLASAGVNGEIAFWDVKTAQKLSIQSLGRWDWYPALAFSPDGTKLISFGTNRPVIWDRGHLILYSGGGRETRMTDVSTGRELATLQHDVDDKAFTVSPDGKMVAFAGVPNELLLWDTETGGVQKILLSEAVKNGFRGRFRDMPDFAIFTALTFSPDSKILVSGSHDGKIQALLAATGETLPTFEGLMERENLGAISALALSPDSTLLAAESRDQLHLWDVRTGHKLFFVSTVHERVRVIRHNNPELTQQGLQVDRQGDRVTRTIVYRNSPELLVFSPDGTILVRANNRGTIQLWDVTTGDKIAALDGHTEQVEALKFSPDAETLVSTGQDGTIFLWDWEEAITGASSTDKDPN